MKLDGPVKKRLTLRLNAEQWEIVSAVAKRANLTSAEVMRLSIYALKRRLPRGFSDRMNDPPEEFQNGVRRLWKEINAVGVNINQLTRLAHTADDAELVSLVYQAQADLHELKEAVNDFVHHDS